MDTYCVVFVCNKEYFDKFLYTCYFLLTNGNYNGDICLVIGDDLLNNNLLEHDLIRNNNITIKYFPTFKFPDYFMNLASTMDRPDFLFTKIFQYHKIHIFNSYFKKWDYIFYIDCGMQIFNDIQPMIDLKQKNTLLAHSDAYPTYEWKLEREFAHDNDYYTKLSSLYDLNIDYFQTGIMLYDTDIIKENTFDNIYNLLLEYPICIANDQSIIALYFICVKPYWKQIQIENDEICFYDYGHRNPNKNYIMYKY